MFRGPPESCPQLEELRSGEWVTEPDSQKRPPGAGPVRLAGGRSRIIRARKPPRRTGMDSADAIVIGSGAFGSSTAYHLARRGAKVVLVDQHALGSQTS